MSDRVSEQQVIIIIRCVYMTVCVCVGVCVCVCVCVCVSE